jgi:hypothetical protein
MYEFFALMQEESGFLNFSNHFEADFVAVIFASAFRRFPFAPEAFYKGKRVRVTGKIEKYRGKPEIVLAAAIASISIRLKCLLVSGFSYPAAFWRDMKGAALGWFVKNDSAPSQTASAVLH